MFEEQTIQPKSDIMPSAPTDSYIGTASFNGLPPAMTVLYGLIGAIGILGNGLVIYVLVRTSPGRQATNLFIVNQSAIDLFASTMLIGCYLTPEVHLSTADLPGGLAKFTCTFWLSKYPFWGAVMASTGNLMCLTLERYVAVLRPHRYQRLFRFERSIWLAVLPWVAGYAYQSYWPTLQYVDPATGECVHGSPGAITQKVLGVVIFVVQYILPLTFMAFVYTKIAKSLQNRVGTTRDSVRRHQGTASALTGPAHPGPGHQEAANDGQEQPNFRLRARKSVFRTLLFVCLAFCVCWTPNQVCYFYYNMGGDINYEGALFFATISLAFCNMVANPFIYSFSYRHFRSGLKQTCPCFRRVRGAQEQSTSATSGNVGVQNV